MSFSVTEHQQQVRTVIKETFALSYWTFTATVNFPSMGTSTFLVISASTDRLTTSPLLHQEGLKMKSEALWAKQLTLSWQNGFHPSVCITDAFNLSVTAQWRTSEALTAVSSFIRIKAPVEWNEQTQKPAAIYFYTLTLQLEIGFFERS